MLYYSNILLTALIEDNVSRFLGFDTGNISRFINQSLGISPKPIEYDALAGIPFGDILNDCVELSDQKRKPVHTRLSDIDVFVDKGTVSTKMDAGQIIPDFMESALTINRASGLPVEVDCGVACPFIISDEKINLAIAPGTVISDHLEKAMHIAEASGKPVYVRCGNDNEQELKITGDGKQNLKELVELFDKARSEHLQTTTQTKPRTQPLKL